MATSNSWGCYCYSQALYEAIRDAGQRGGILFVAAAGNDRMNNDTRRAFYPASYDLGNVISVAAIDEWGGLASFGMVQRPGNSLGIAVRIRAWRFALLDRENPREFSRGLWHGSETW